MSNTKGVKFTISGEANSGKTSLTEGLKDTLVISHDGKGYPFATPHGMLKDFSTTAELREFVEQKAAAYADRFGDFPGTIIFDSISRIYETIHGACALRYTGFAIYSQLDKEIKELNDFIENDLIANGINVGIISHAIYDADTSKYSLVGKGSFSKIGGFLSVVDEGLFIETKNDKRIVHYRSTKFPARSLIKEFPDNAKIDAFSLQEYISTLEKHNSQASDFEL